MQVSVSTSDKQARASELLREKENITKTNHKELMDQSLMRKGDLVLA